MQSISIMIICILYSLSKLTELKVLDLEGNNFSDGLPDVIGQLTSLNTLNLGGCNLSTLPVG